MLDISKQTAQVKSPKLSTENDPEWITVHWRSDAVNQALDAYLEVGRSSLYHAESSPYLFPSQQSEQITYTTVNRIVKDAAENAGIQSITATDSEGNERASITSHVLRHSYAMQCLENGMNITEVKAALHHQKIETTMKYLREHEDDRRKSIMNHGPTFGE
jgi:integrase/recombinase XerD